MLIIPSLYLQKGHTVSLYKGVENDQKKIYPAAPLKIARQFEKEGASLLHVTDLDAALGLPINQEFLKKLRSEISIPIEVGGGIRDLDGIETLISLGIDRVIVGVSARTLIPEALKRYGPSRVIFGIKARKSFVDSDALGRESDEVLEIAEQVIEQGIRQIVYKDLEREGTLFHPNYDEIEKLIYFMPPGVKFFSSGGVAGLHDLQILNELGTAGTLIGRALMEHAFSFKKAKALYERPDEVPLRSADEAAGAS